MDIKTLDIGKSTFHLAGYDGREHPLKQKLAREKLMRAIANLPACLIGMESCPGLKHLARRFAESGHEVRLMAAQLVKPYVKGNKSDFLDAEAIAEAMTRPTMRLVPVKTPPSRTSRRSTGCARGSSRNARWSSTRCAHFYSSTA